MKERHEQQPMDLVLTATDITTLNDKVLFERLAKYINDLVNHDFEYLLSLLYRIDVEEKNIRAVLSAQPGADAGELIAQLIIDRQEQKIKSREQFKPPPNIPEEEKW